MGIFYISSLWLHFGAPYRESYSAVHCLVSLSFFWNLYRISHRSTTLPFHFILHYQWDTDGTHCCWHRMSLYLLSSQWSHLPGWLTTVKKTQGNSFLGCPLQIGGSILQRESFSSFCSFMPLSLWWWGSGGFCDDLEVSSLLSRCKSWPISPVLSTLDFSCF